MRATRLQQLRVRLDDLHPFRVDGLLDLLFHLERVPELGQLALLHAEALGALPRQLLLELRAEAVELRLGLRLVELLLLPLLRAALHLLVLLLKRPRLRLLRRVSRLLGVVGVLEPELIAQLAPLLLLSAGGEFLGWRLPRSDLAPQLLKPLLRIERRGHVCRHGEGGGGGGGAGLLALACEHRRVALLLGSLRHAHRLQRCARRLLRHLLLLRDGTRELRILTAEDLLRSRLVVVAAALVGGGDGRNRLRRWRWFWWRRLLHWAPLSAELQGWW